MITDRERYYTAGKVYYARLYNLKFRLVAIKSDQDYSSKFELTETERHRLSQTTEGRSTLSKLVLAGLVAQVKFGNGKLDLEHCRGLRDFKDAEEPLREDFPDLIGRSTTLEMFFGSVLNDVCSMAAWDDIRRLASSIGAKEPSIAADIPAGNKEEIDRSPAGYVSLAAWLSLVIVFGISMFQGGGAISAVAKNGHLYFTNHGVYTEVSRTTFLTSCVLFALSGALWVIGGIMKWWYKGPEPGSGCLIAFGLIWMVIALYKLSSVSGAL